MARYEMVCSRCLTTIKGKSEYDLEVKWGRHTCSNKRDLNDMPMELLRAVAKNRMTEEEAWAIVDAGAKVVFNEVALTPEAQATADKFVAEVGTTPELTEAEQAAADKADDEFGGEVKSIEELLKDVRDNVFGNNTALYECFTDTDLIEDFNRFRAHEPHPELVTVGDWIYLQLDVERIGLERDGVSSDPEIKAWLKEIRARADAWLAEHEVHLAERTTRLFIAYAKDAGNWSGTPLVGGNVGGVKGDEGCLTHLKKAGLLVTFDGHGDKKRLKWVRFTRKGRQFAIILGLDAGSME